MCHSGQQCRLQGSPLVIHPIGWFWWGYAFSRAIRALWSRDQAFDIWIFEEPGADRSWSARSSPVNALCALRVLDRNAAATEGSSPSVVSSRPGSWRSRDVPGMPRVQHRDIFSVVPCVLDLTALVVRCSRAGWRICGCNRMSDRTHSRSVASRFWRPLNTFSGSRPDTPVLTCCS